MHIVWNDHYRPYDPKAIKMGFGQVQLVVTPLPNTLYLITVHRDPSVSTFGWCSGTGQWTRGCRAGQRCDAGGALVECAGRVLWPARASYGGVQACAGTTCADDRDECIPSCPIV